jgi:hypothetical protein
VLSLLGVGGFAYLVSDGKLVDLSVRFKSVG